MLIAADTNVLLDLAEEVETVADAISTIRERLQDARFVVPPTALHELASAVRGGETGRIRKTAFRALIIMFAFPLCANDTMIPCCHAQENPRA